MRMGTPIRMVPISGNRDHGITAFTARMTLRTSANDVRAELHEYRKSQQRGCTHAAAAAENCSRGIADAKKGK